jgi:hypothetical protein
MYLFLGINTHIHDRIRSIYGIIYLHWSQFGCIELRITRIKIYAPDDFDTTSVDCIYKVDGSSFGFSTDLASVSKITIVWTVTFGNKYYTILF